MDNTPDIWRVELQPYQAGFFRSEVRFPGLFSAWGTGKTMTGILKGMKLSEDYPDNLGVIIRKEFTDLQASTMKDFTTYTGIPLTKQQKEVILPNKSTILFLHGDELDVVKNMNLGWYLLEQAEEIENPDVFDYLDGRLRRASAGLRQGMVIGNTTEEEHWIYRYYKSGLDPRFKCWEANSFDNTKNLPADTLESWRMLEARNRPVYLRYVMNQWGIGGDQFVVISPEILGVMKGSDVKEPVRNRRVITCDPAIGGDECVAYALDETKITKSLYLSDRDTMKIAGHLSVMSGDTGIDDIAVDTIGIGAGIADRLTEMKKRVIRINSAEKSTSPRYNNRRTEIMWHVREKFQDKSAWYPEDPELRRQMVATRYKVVNSNGQVACEPKADVKKRIGCSPDRADAYNQGVWALQYVQPPVEKDEWAEKRRQASQGQAGSWMTA